MTDRSTHPTVVEYGVREMFKRKSPRAAARATAKKLSGFENMFLGPGTTTIDPAILEAALWDRIVEQARKNLTRIKPGAERIGLLGTLDHFHQPESSLPELERRLARTTSGDRSRRRRDPPPTKRFQFADVHTRRLFEEMFLDDVGARNYRQTLAGRSYWVGNQKRQGPLLAVLGSSQDGRTTYYVDEFGNVFLHRGRRRFQLVGNVKTGPG